MRVCVVSLAIGFGTVLGLGCRDMTVCPAILALKPTIPDTTTIKVGAATIAVAGATWGGCDDGPGQACGYKVGHSEINRQRDKAKAALGATYDLKAFDDTVVRGGDVPLDVLAKNVDEYVGRRPPG